MPMNEVTLNKKQAGQKESNEKVGSSDFQGHLQPCREVVGLPPAGGHGEEGLCAGQRRDLVEVG